MDTIFDFISDWVLPPVMITILGFAIVVLFVVLPIGIYQECTSEHISIKKDDWQCTSYRTYYYSGYMAGKAYVPARTSRECETYQKRKDH